MAPTTKDTIEVLNDLVETARDGEHGYRTAAEDAKDPSLQARFQTLANQRATFVRELQEQVEALGGEVEESGSAAGALHRGWINVKSAFSSDEPHSVLEECERGEDAAVEAYQKAVNADHLDAATHAIVRRQCAAVQAAHDEIKALRDNPAYAER